MTPGHAGTAAVRRAAAGAIQAFGAAREIRLRGALAVTPHARHAGGGQR